ncbi:MAG TPA: nucleotidyltransferase family protein, partial [Casimicrobiaceae bacterium]|nr:nucleotidyltransferase family protein [Casimicrobiaceae bacterium]
GGTVGVPAIFPRWCFSELAQLRGDNGAKSILDRYRDRLAHVAMPNAALDLDTTEDLARVQRTFGPQAANDDR